MFYAKKSFRSMKKVFAVALIACLALVAQSALAFSNEKPVFNVIEVKQVAAPEGFLNARRYRLTYFYKDENSSRQVFPTLEEKKRDYDLILARAVREYIEDEYFTKNKGMDEHVVSDSNKGEIFDLVGRQYLSDAWADDNFNALRQYINRNYDNIKLFIMDVYLDYSLPDGGYNYGNDHNPIILSFSRKDTRPDEAIFIQVNVSDK